MTRQSSAHSAGEQTEPIRQAFENLVWRKDSRSDRGELDRQRQSIEAPAEICDRCAVGVGQLESAGRCGRSLGKQQDGLVLAQLIEWLESALGRQLERRERN